MKYERKVNLSTKSCFDISELEDNLRNCSECKKLLEIREVAQKVAEQLLESPRPYFPVLTCAVTSKTNLNSKNVRHYSNKKYWPFKYLVTGAKGGGEEEGRGGGRGGGKREREKGKELTLPNPSPFFPSPQFDTFPSLHIRF